MTMKNVKNNNASLPLDTPVGPAYDIEKELSSSCLTRGSIGQSNHYYGFSGRTPNGVCRRMTGESELSSSGPTGGSIMAQSGRSIVEMLGTLAIIGVLSIGGIAGYRYGMDKYRANETLKDINLRVVDLLTQASQGREALSLAEWENEDSIYDFSNPAYVEGENLIAFDVGTTKKLPKSVCQAVFDGLANTAVQIDINDVPGNSNEDCGTDNTMTFYFEGGGNGTGGETTGEQCGSTVCGTCQKCSCDPSLGVTAFDCGDNKTCIPVNDYEMKCTTTDNKSGWCVSGVCEPDTTCNCGEGQYCTDTNESNEYPTPSGTCKELDFRTVDIDGTTYYISNSTMSWWDAVSACEALGNKQLLGKNNLTVSCKYGEDTGCTSTNTTLSDLSYKLAVFFDNNQVWTKDLSTPFSAYSVYITCSSCALYDAPRTYKYYFAVCH